jgi:hypothetical protein
MRALRWSGSVVREVVLVLWRESELHYQEQPTRVDEWKTSKLNGAEGT